MIYLASPYSHSDPTVPEQRFRQVCRVASRLMREGHIVFSPIAHSHPIAMAGGLPTDWTFWKEFDRAMLGAASELWVLRIPGWMGSRGIASELTIWHYRGPVKFIDPLPEELLP